MKKCDNCGKNLSISRDNINAWCNSCDSHYAFVNENFFFVGKGNYIQYMFLEDGELNPFAKKQYPQERTRLELLSKEIIREIMKDIESPRVRKILNDWWNRQRVEIKYELYRASQIVYGVDN